MSNELPIVAVPMGDPAGIGPEVTVKSLYNLDVYKVSRPMVVGDARALAKAPGWKGEPRIVKVENPREIDPTPGVVWVLDMNDVPEDLKIAEVSIAGGKAAINYLTTAVNLAAAEGKVDAVASAPMHKGAMKKAGFHFGAEYDYMSHITNTAEYTMLTVSPTFTLATVVMHVPFKDIASLVTKDRILNTIRHSYIAARATGVEKPRIGVAALNPHAGEEGLTGREEIDEIAPAIEAARSEGIDASGPWPADTFYMTAKQHAYDVYVGMYHDQGRIAMKLLDFGRAVTVAEGLPLVFATVGHGTAFDIAGKGVANVEGLQQAFTLASRMATLARAA